MKKPIFPRILIIFAIYVGIFILLVAIQFSRQRSFTQRVGDFVVTGHYGKGSEASRGRDRPLEGEARVLYGGMEFLLTDRDGDDSLSLLAANGRRAPTKAVSMAITNGEALFQLVGGAGLGFSVQIVGGAKEIWIRAALPEGYRGLELPYRPLTSSRIRHGEDGEYQIIADGKSYRFANSAVDAGRRLIAIDAASPMVSYGAVPGMEVLDPSRFVLAAAQDRQAYDEALNQWREKSYAQWGLDIAGNPDEETALAYLSESARRGTYKAALAAISPAFLEGSQRSFASSAYLGRLDQGLRSSASFERETLSRLKALISEASADFLKDFHVVEFLAIRGYGSLIDSAIPTIHSINPADLALDLVPGILEGYMDWQNYRPSDANPFKGLVDQSCFAISEDIVMDSQGERIFVLSQGAADLEFNLRLGAALASYGEHTAQEVWTGIGRSLVLSTLALTDESGAAPRALALAADGDLVPAANAAPLGAARIYQRLRLGEYAARAVGLGSAMSGVWAWTAASGATASYSQENKLLDISMSFATAETHYLLIRGIPSFTQIQIDGQPWRMDPQFERYDSSGWAYSPSEQTLMVKMKHRLPTEHLLIYF